MHPVAASLSATAVCPGIGGLPFLLATRIEANGLLIGNADRCRIRRAGERPICVSRQARTLWTGGQARGALGGSANC